MDIWYKDIYGFLFNKDTVLDIIPDKSNTLAEQLNNTMRFAVYLTLVLFVIRRDANPIYFTVFVAFVTWVIWGQYGLENDKRKELFTKLNIEEDFKKRPCIKPTKDNPFMNVSAIDYSDFPNRPKACVNDPDTNKFFEEGLNRKEDDIFFKSASDRQFFTMPYTTIPNDQNTFAEWLYKTGPTCKEKSMACYGPK